MTTAETQVLHAPATQRMLWRAAVYEAIALAFSYPEEETFATLAAGLDDLLDHDVTDSADERPAIEALAAALAATNVARAALVHNRLFAGEVVCSASETEYEFDTFAKARQLADIAGFYRAFGLKMAADRPGAADALDAELEFMAQVVVREAYAATQGWDERRQICTEAQRSFLEDHLGRWVPLFCRKLCAEEDAEGFYVAAATLCELFVGNEVRASGARPRPLTDRRASPADESAFTCMFASPGEEDKEDQP